MDGKLLGVLILAASGAAWFVAGAVNGHVRDMLIPAGIIVGFAMVAWGLRGPGRTRIVAAGFAVEAAAAAVFWGLYGVAPAIDADTSTRVLMIAGFLLAAYGALRSAALAVRAGVAASIPFAAMNVATNELSGIVNVWSVGNVLFFVGAVWTALAWSEPRARASVAPA